MSRLFALVLPCVLVACSKNTDDWLNDLTAEETFTRLLAAVALREAPPEQHAGVVSALFHAVRVEEDEGVRGEAMATLQALAAQSLDLFVRLLGKPESLGDRWDLINIIVGQGDRTRPHLAAALHDDPAELAAVAMALGRVGGVTELLAWASDSRPDKLAAAIAGLTAAKAEEAIPDLTNRLLAGVGESPNDSVTVAIKDASRDSATAAWSFVAALDGLPGQSREPVLSALISGVLWGHLRDEQSGTAATLLGYLGDRAVPHLIDRVVEAEDERVRYWAASALVAMGPKTLPAMLEGSVDDRWILYALSAFGELGKVALHAAAKSKNLTVQRAAQRFIGQ